MTDLSDKMTDYDTLLPGFWYLHWKLQFQC